MNLMDPQRRQRLERLAAEHALGTLSRRARNRLSALARRHPSIAEALHAWDLRLAGLAAAVAPVTPPPRVWAGIVQRLGLHGVPSEAAWRARLRLWRRIAVASAAGTVALGLIHFTAHINPARPTLLAVLQTPDSRPAWIATSHTGDGTLTLKALSKPDIAADRSLQLWAVPQSGAPRSLGLLPPTGRGRLVVRTASLEDIATLAVSAEPSGGSTTGAPTGPIVYQGSLERISE